MSARNINITAHGVLAGSKVRRRAANARRQRGDEAAAHIRRIGAAIATESRHRLMCFNVENEKKLFTTLNSDAMDSAKPLNNEEQITRDNNKGHKTSSIISGLCSYVNCFQISCAPRQHPIHALVRVCRAHVWPGARVCVRRRRHVRGSSSYRSVISIRYLYWKIHADVICSTVKPFPRKLAKKPFLIFIERPFSDSLAPPGPVLERRRERKEKLGHFIDFLTCEGRPGAIARRFICSSVRRVRVNKINRSVRPLCAPAQRETESEMRRRKKTATIANSTRCQSELHRK